MFDADVIPVITGPTASGKTAFAVSLAADIGAEIVSADSMQIYKHMDIGTAKATQSEMRGIKHHMIDVVEPDERFSVADYKKMAYARIRDIIARGRRVVVAGGTGLYISALVYNIRYPDIAADPLYRERLFDTSRTSGNAALHSELARVDPVAAGKIHENDTKRIIRALEVYRATGKTIGEHERESRLEPPGYKFKLIGLDVPRGELIRRIDARVDGMFENGLIDEARFLYERYGKNGTAAQAIGYKELFLYFEGAGALPETVEKIKIGTRRYAKRQMTWFRSMPEIEWNGT